MLTIRYSRSSSGLWQTLFFDIEYIEFQESVPECHTFLISLLDMDFIPAADDHIPHQPCISDCLAFSLDFPFFLQYNTSDREVVFPWSTESKHIYTFENTCREVPGLLFGDETVKVIVNTRGEIGEISEELKEVIRYLNDGTVTGQYSQELDTAVSAVKSNEERRLEYMTLAMHDMEIREEALEEGLEKGREEGRIEGREKGKDEMAVSSLRTIMKKMKLSAEGAMDFMDIPAEDQPKYALMLREE